MLKSQQEAARFRRKATEQGFEINISVPLGLVERKQQQRRQLDEQRERDNVYKLNQEVIVKTYEGDAFLREVIAQQPAGDNKHIAIIGEPGAGKTTLLSTIASFIKDKTQDLPICISLANLQGQTIEKYLLERWLPKAMGLVKPDVVVTPKIECQLIECFGKRGVWLLLDGVDEMGENSPVQALAKINQELTISLIRARVVLTCRLNVWDAQVNNTLTGFNTYKTQEFKPEQIDDFIQQWFECAKDSQKGETLKVKLKETKHENIHKLVTNPLRLSLLCQTFSLDKWGELPKTKTALYQRFTRYFYEWKSELFPELYQSDKLKTELHHALSKLAFAGIKSSARFRLPQSLVHKKMGEKLFKLARDVGWLNLVDRVMESEEEVYAFFHPNFQEYFAALTVNDWHDFLNHVPEKPTQRTYRIFESQWRETILLWLGREEENFKQQKQEFIDALVNFKDGCGKWNKENLNKGFYEYRAYFLAAAGIAEFRGDSKEDEIVAQIVKWGFGYLNKKQEWVSFLEPIREEAKLVLQQTDRTKAIAALVQLLQSQDIDDNIRWQAIESLGRIGTENKIAIAALVNLLNSTKVGFISRQQAFFSLEQIGIGNEQAITALVQLLQHNVDFYTSRQAVSSLGQIGVGNEQAITALVELLNLENVNYYIRTQAVESLGLIGAGNKQAITTLVQLLNSEGVDDDTRKQAAKSLGQIGIGKKQAIVALLQLLKSENVNHYISIQAAESLGLMYPGNRKPITTLIQLLTSPKVDIDTHKRAFDSLEQIGIGNEQAIAALAQLLNSENVYYYIRIQAAESLEKIGIGNQTAIDALVKLLSLKGIDNDISRQAAHSLGQIGIDNQTAIDALVKLLSLEGVNDDTRREAFHSLKQIGIGDEQAIAALVQLLKSENVHHYIRTQAAESLEKIGIGNKQAIAALIKLLKSTQISSYTRKLAAHSLGGIAIDNEEAIAVLVQLLESKDVDYHTRKRIVYNLGEIGTGKKQAIAALVQLLQSKDVDNATRRQAVESLGKVGTGNKKAIAALVQLLQSQNVDDYTHWQAADSLEKIGTGNEKAIAAFVQLLQSLNSRDQDYWNFSNLIWKCVHNTPYPDFHKAWHQHNFATRVMRSLKKILFTRI